MNTDASPPQQQQSFSKLQISLIIIFGIFATTLPQPQVLGKLPLQNLLKNELHVSRADMASFFFLCGLFWYLKPIAGLLTDAFPLFGTRRRWYLILAGLFAFLSWIGLGLAPHTYAALLVAAIVVNLFMVMASTVVGAFLVEAGQRLQATGRLTSLRMFIQSFCSLVNGPLSGYLAGGAFMTAAGVSGVFVVSIVPVAYILMREPIVRTSNTAAFANAGSQLRRIFSYWPLWMALFFIALYYFAPGFSTPLFYKQQDELKLSVQFIGNLGVYAGFAGLVSAALYSQLVKYVQLRTMLFIAIALAGGSTLMYLFYNGPIHAILIEAQAGFFGTFAELAIMDLAARATPKGCEGMGYSLMLSLRNVALFGADIVGSKLADNHWPFSKLVFLNAGTTFVVLLLIPLLPGVLVRSTDSKTMATGQPTSKSLEDLPPPGEGPTLTS